MARIAAATASGSACRTCRLFAQLPIVRLLRSRFVARQAYVTNAARTNDGRSRGAGRRLRRVRPVEAGAGDGRRLLVLRVGVDGPQVVLLAVGDVLGRQYAHQ